MSLQAYKTFVPTTFISIYAQYIHILQILRKVFIVTFSWQSIPVPIIFMVGTRNLIKNSICNKNRVNNLDGIRGANYAKVYGLVKFHLFCIFYKFTTAGDPCPYNCVPLVKVNNLLSQHFGARKKCAKITQTVHFVLNTILWYPSLR